MIDRKFCIPNFKRLNSNQNALLGQRKLTIRGVQKTDEPNKLVETDRTEFNFSIRFRFDLISVSVSSMYAPNRPKPNRIINNIYIYIYI